MKPSNEDKNHQNQLMQGFSKFSQIGITIAACIFIGALSGHFLDGFFGTSPWLLMVFSFLGVGAAFKSLYDLTKRL